MGRWGRFGGLEIQYAFDNVSVGISPPAHIVGKLCSSRRCGAVEMGHSRGVALMGLPSWNRAKES